MSSTDPKSIMAQHVRLLSSLRNQRVDWGPSRTWGDFRDLVPLALAGRHSLDIYFKDLAPKEDDFNIRECYKEGLARWIHRCALSERLKNPAA